MGKLIVIDGVDASGKQTQSQLLSCALAEAGHDIKQIHFPDYEDDSSALVRMYLSGELSSSADDVNCYAASVFYAADRYASYKKHWESYYLGGGVIIADRYTTSNAIHQSAKLSPGEQKPFLDWLYDFEYSKMLIPAPDLVIFLDMPPEYAVKLMEERYEGDESKKDIHEKDMNFLQRSYDAAVTASEYSGWQRVRCVENGSVRSRESIHREVMEIVTRFLCGEASDKIELRSEAAAIKQSLSDEQRNEWDEVIFKSVTASQYYKSAKDIYIYYSACDEVGTEKIIDKAMEDGKNIYLPVCNTTLCTMEFYKVRQGETLYMNKYGIPEPSPKAENKAKPRYDSVIFVPGVMFDSSGSRLGRGKGYYDRFLEGFPGKSIGLCYEALIKEHISCGEHDKKVQAIITEKGVTYCDC